MARKYKGVYKPSKEFERQTWGQSENRKEWQSRAKKSRPEMTRALADFINDIAEQYSDPDILMGMRKRHGITLNTMAKLLISPKGKPEEIAKMEEGIRKITPPFACTLYLLACMLHLLDDSPYNLEDLEK